MVAAWAILLLCQLAGEGVGHATGLPIPGPVIGLVLLALGLAARERLAAGGSTELRETPLGRSANTLLGHLSLLFVPAAVGIVQQGGVLAANGLTLMVALVVSTVATLAVTAAVCVWATRFLDREGRP